MEMLAVELLLYLLVHMPADFRELWLAEKIYGAVVSV
jgi:hypothetical protein